MDRDALGADIGDQELEVTVSEERPVVEKRTVAKERVTVGKDTETTEETVGGEVRKERVEIDDTTKRGRNR